MRIAIPSFRDRVSPVLDTAEQFRIFELRDGAADEQPGASLPGVALPSRLSQLKQLGCRVVLCGGVSEACRRLAQSLGLQVVPWLRGSIETVLKAYATGQLQREEFVMPGCGKRCRRRRGGGGRGRQGRGRR
jgi:predicted Fe-Mo cluster-binding NifX family protein